MRGINIIKMARVGACFFILLFLIFLVFIDEAYCDPGPNKNDYGTYLRLFVTFAQAKALQKTGLLNEPIKGFTDALDLARKAGDHKIEVECLMSLGIISWDKGEVSLSSQYYFEALKIAQKNGFKQINEFCRTVINIHSLFKEAKELRINKNYTRAKNKYSQAISLARNINSVNHEVKCLRQMSAIYFIKYYLHKYFQVNSEALMLARKNRILREEGYCSYNIALYFIKNGNCNKSFYLLNRSLEIALLFHDLEDKIDCYYLIGFMFCELGNYEFSLKYLHKALSITQDVKKSIELFNAIGITLKRKADKLGDINYFEANCYYRKALSLATNCHDIALEVIALNNIGSSYFAQNKYHKALLYFRECLKYITYIDSLDIKSIILTNMGNTNYELNNLNHAREYFLRASEIVKNDEIPKLLWESFYGLGKCYEKEKHVDLALFYYKKAISMLDKIDHMISLDIDRANFIKDKFRAHDSIIKLLYLKLLKNNYCQSLKSELLYYMDKSKGTILYGQFRGNNDNEYNSIGLNQCVNDEYCKLVKNATNNDSSSSKLHCKYMESAYSSAYDLNNSKYPHRNERQYQASEFSLIGENNIKNAAIISYSIGEEISILAVIINNDIEYYQLPGRDKIERSIRAYLKLISSPSNDRFIGRKAATRILNEIFFPVLENRFKKIKKIIIIPDGLLFYLPFETLVLESTGNKSCMFVIEKYDVSYSPSLSFLHALNQNLLEKKTRDNCLIIGDPDYNSFKSLSDNQYLNAFMNKLERYGFSLDPLPYTKEEALMIKNVIKSKKAKVCLNHEASEDNLKKMNLKKYNIIHFACHGFIDEEAPTRSALVLSNKQGSKQDGLLQVGEIYDLELDADLVVLSACQTGRGHIARGEGILGLTRTFFYSGARSVISTLWSIKDISTAIFMKHFYLYLSMGMTKSEALRSAKLKMIYSQYSHPFYWAAFILNGDYKSRFDWH